MVALGVGSALVASVAAVSVLVLRQHSAPLADEVVIAHMPSAAAPATRPTARSFARARTRTSSEGGAYFARIRLFLASWVNSARPRASSNGGM